MTVQVKILFLSFWIVLIFQSDIPRQPFCLNTCHNFFFPRVALLEEDYMFETTPMVRWFEVYLVTHFSRWGVAIRAFLSYFNKAW